MRPAIEELRHAFDSGEFVLHYQPILRLRDGRMAGAEVLLRWNRPRDGLVPPAQFLPVLAESRLVVEIGCWAVREAARQAVSWRMLYGREVADWVAVAMPARFLDDVAPLAASLRAIGNSGFAADRIMLGIGEAALLRHPPTTRAALAALAALGVRVAVEDFTGAAAPLLRRAPIDTIKIDAGRDAAADTPPAEMLRAVAESGTAIIAGGIADAAQRDRLAAVGCGFGQGYLFAEPMDGALLGAYALSHAVGPSGPAPQQPDAAAAALNRPTSRGRSQAR
jgi:EAL domain-containing protein (putative c-di-GMP-specific phosphodiesterase class I)